MRYFIYCFLFLFLLNSCAQQSQQGQNNESSTTTESGKNEQALIEQGIAISAELQQTLSGHLKKAVEDSGVAFALNYCNLNAYPLTDSIAQLHEVIIKRISHKARNQQNRADQSELSMINQFQADLDKGEAASPKIVEDPDRHTFFAPIMIQAPLCLKCHGEPEKDIAPEDFITIKMLYPEDEATGFKLNDLRGLWRIDFMKNRQAL